MSKAIGRAAEGVTLSDGSRALASRLLVVAALLFVLFLAAFLLWWRPADVRAASVTRGDVRLEAAGTATIESERTILVASTAGGRLESIRFGVGERIRAADEVARLDVDELELQRRASVLAERRARALLARGAAELESAVSAATLARKALERAEVLHRQGALSSTALDEARAARDEGEANRRALAAALAQARAELESAEEGTRLLAHRIGEGRLTSPIDGIVVRRLREPGDVVAPGQPVLEVAATGKIWASAWIDESALPHLRVGAPARIVLRSVPDREILGRVDRIAPQADRETHELLVDVELLEVPDPLVFGQRADVFIALQESRDVLRIPRGFCPEATRCLVEREGRIALVPIELGLVGSEAIEVKSGLALGEMVVLSEEGASREIEGRRVRRRP
ncbi:MAG TPA: efflux RND transporter periplasmic adaptor subunit [Vulgatibacter sp.]|nr:efflux RND transporter periplasmic adaptor subunit [Vulgatibacter sp.]